MPRDRAGSSAQDRWILPRADQRVASHRDISPSQHLEALRELYEQGQLVDSTNESR